MCEHGSRGGSARAFNLIELVIVLVIIGVITAIAVPRMAQATTRAKMAKLTQDYDLMQSAVDLYSAEHHGKRPRLSTFVAHMTQYTDVEGAVSAVRDPGNGYVYGPYLRAIPTIAIGPHAGETGVASFNGSGVGWLYWESWGIIFPNIWDEGNEVPDDLEEIIEDWYTYLGHDPP